MKLGLMPGVPAAEMRKLGFEALQLFYGSKRQEDDPTAEAVDHALGPGLVALAAMTIHLDLVGPRGVVEPEVDRAVGLVRKTAALTGRFGDNEHPILVWHPSGYPDGADDRLLFRDLCDALRRICKAAEQERVHLAVELTRAGSVSGADSYLRLKDAVASPALRVCMDAANFVPDRTPLVRAVRMLGPDIVIAHAKDSRFAENGEVSHYGAVGTGTLDYAAYLRCLKEYSSAPYLVLEYYRDREEMLRARDIVLKHLQGAGA